VYPTSARSNETLDSGESDGDGSGGDAFVVDEIEEVISQFLFVDLVGGFCVVGGELLDSEEIDGLGLGRDATELHVVEHALA